MTCYYNEHSLPLYVGTPKNKKTKKLMQLLLFSETTTRPIRYILIGTAIGYLMKFACIEYLKRHPELANSKKLTSRKTAKPEIIRPPSKIWVIRKLRGGVFVSSSIVTVLTILAQGGEIIGLIGGYITLASKLPKTALVSIIYKSSPQNLPITSLIVLPNLETDLKSLDWLCDKPLKFLFAVLTDETLPFERKQKAVSTIFADYLDLSTEPARIKFVLCIVILLFILYGLNIGSYLLLLNQLYEALKAGKISKVVYHAILRRLKKRGIPIVDPNLI